MIHLRSAMEGHPSACKSSRALLAHETWWSVKKLLLSSVPPIHWSWRSQGIFWWHPNSWIWFFWRPSIDLTRSFTRIRKANLQVNVTKSKFAAIETEYLGFNISRQGVKPQEKKIEAILNIATPTHVCQVWNFLGSINHYKQMIPHRSHVATELTAHTKKGDKFKWTPNCQAAFDTLRLELAKRFMLTSLKFTLMPPSCNWSP